MKKRDNHEDLIDHGVDLYNDGKFRKALPCLKKAYKMAPNCIAAQYNYGIVLHMLSRHKKAVKLLKTVVKTKPKRARKNCPTIGEPRAFVIDAHMSIFYAMIHRKQGYTQKAFDYAYKYLELRKKDIPSTWSKREAKKEIRAEMRRWKKKR